MSESCPVVPNSDYVDMAGRPLSARSRYLTARGLITDHAFKHLGLATLAHDFAQFNLIAQGDDEA